MGKRAKQPKRKKAEDSPQTRTGRLEGKRKLRMQQARALKRELAETLDKRVNRVIRRMEKRAAWYATGTKVPFDAPTAKIQRASLGARVVSGTLPAQGMTKKSGSHSDGKHS